MSYVSFDTDVDIVKKNLFLTGVFSETNLGLQMLTK